MKKNSLFIVMITLFIFINACQNDNSRVPDTVEPTSTPPNWDDTTIYNYTGIWHNEGLAYVLSTFEGINEDSLKNWVNDDAWTYTHTYQSGLSFVKTISELVGIGIDTTGMWNLFQIATPICYASAMPENDFLQLFDSVVTANLGNQFYIGCIEDVLHRAKAENYEQLLSEYLSWTQQNQQLTEDEKNFSRVAVSVAMSSRYFWYAKGYSIYGKRNDINKIQGTLGWLIAADLVGAALSVFADLTDGQPNDPWKIAGRAAVFGIGTSILGWIGSKIGGKSRNKSINFVS